LNSMSSASSKIGLNGFCANSGVAAGAGGDSIPREVASAAVTLFSAGGSDGGLHEVRNPIWARVIAIRRTERIIWGIN